MKKIFNQISIKQVLTFAWIVFLTSMGTINSFMATAQVETYSWGNVSMGGGGFVSGLVTSKTEQNLIYARTDVGGAYRWDNATEKWIPLLDWVNENQLSYLGVESIAIDPVQSNKVYMLVGTSYFNNGATAILRSDDYGNTFSITNVSNQFKAHGNGMGRQTGEKLVVDPNNNDILFCGSRNNGLFKSINAGVSWSQVNSLGVSTTPSGNGISFVIMDPNTGTTGNATQTIVVGVSRSGSENLYRSDDGGVTFSAIADAPTALMPHRAVLASDNNLYITYANNAGPWDITGSGALLKYNLTSGAWSNVTPSGFSGAFGGISVAPNDPMRLVASSVNTYLNQNGSWGDRIFLSTNGGTSWTDLVAQGFEIDPNGSPWIEGHAIHWAGCVEFDPFDTKKAWIISGNGIFQTDDIDATTNVWKFQVSGLEETVPLDIVSVANGPLLTAIGDYDGFRHLDVTQYAPIHTPRMGTTTGIATASLNSNVVTRVGQHSSGGSTVGLIYYSSDQGVSWQERPAAGLSGKLAIAADGKTLIHAPEGSNKTYWSDDTGLTWTISNGLTIQSCVPVADPVNPKIFYAYNNSNGSLMVSYDRGVSFVLAGSPGSGGSKIIRTAPYQTGDIWVPLNNGGLTRSTNGGEHFTKIAAVTSCSAVGFGKEASNTNFPTVFIWGNVNGISGLHRSVDEGNSWTRINDDDHEYGGLANGQFVIGDMNVFGRVYMSTAGRGVIYGESNETCIPTHVEPVFQVNAGSGQSSSYVRVDLGNDVVLSPNPSTGGSWSWQGPDSFSSSDREISLADIQNFQGGIYTAVYTNPSGCASAKQSFLIDIYKPVQQLTITAEDDVAVIVEKNGTLQLTATSNPVDASDPTVSWSITDGDELATLSSTGMLTAQADGIVTVRATANDGSGVFEEIQITISNQMITKSVDYLASTLIYPNPIASTLIISNANSIKQLKIMDSQGRLLLTLKNEKEVIYVDASLWPTGMYIIQVMGHHHLQGTHKMIKK